MSASSRNVFPCHSCVTALHHSKSVLICLPLIALTSVSLPAQGAGDAPGGIAWQVRGLWQIEGKGAPILTGDSVQPGSLLQPEEGTTNQSVNILLPDGQRILYECFTLQDCARGFRVPSLYREPEPSAVDMLARIRAVLASENHDSSMEYSIQQAPRLPRDEVVAVLGPDNQVHVEGLADRLPKGHYTYDLRPVDRAYPRQSHLLTEKNEPSITFALPSSGLFLVTIADDLNTPRIDLFIAAVRPAQAARSEKLFRNAQVLIKEWNEDYQGWPVHDFQRAYLKSLMLDVKPLIEGRQADATGKLAQDEAGVGDTEQERVGVTAEPSFGPKPGLFTGDTAVTLRCDSPGATIHCTVDGSQPVAGSPVYLAPIMVKATELTIKSYGSVVGKKDSAVVTGIFRIQQ
jgi:hypothetical protein